MTQLNEHETFASPRECDCPDWVVRCAHFGEVRLTLGQTYDVGHDPSCHYSFIKPPGPYRLGPYSAPWMKCPGCGLVDGFDDALVAKRQWFHDMTASLDAFYAAEAELLGRAL